MVKKIRNFFTQIGMNMPEVFPLFFRKLSLRIISQIQIRCFIPNERKSNYLITTTIILSFPDLIETINADKIRKDQILKDYQVHQRQWLLSLVFQKTQTTHLVIIPEKEDAAYFYNDLVSLLGEDSVFFFPSTYKRSVQYEQTEPANIVLRTEVLNHLASGKRKGIIVTYPESVMEKVVSRRNLKKNTFNISKGDKISLEFLEEMLHEYNFVRTDFVYEPGQYSIRGSIADVFSYSADLPYRIDFFGEEVETIRIV